MSSQPTYADLHRLFIELGFERRPEEPRWRVYVHRESDAMILLANRPDSSPVTPVDQASVRKHLVDGGWLDDQEFSAFLENPGRSTSPS